MRKVQSGTSVNTSLNTTICGDLIPILVVFHQTNMKSPLNGVSTFTRPEQYVHFTPRPSPKGGTYGLLTVPLGAMDIDCNVSVCFTQVIFTSTVPFAKNGDENNRHKAAVRLTSPCLHFTTPWEMILNVSYKKPG